MKEQSLITKRFLKCFQYLKDRNIVASASKFAESLGVHKQAFSDMAKGNRDVTIDMLKNACELFYINPSYLLLGEGEYLYQEPKSLPQNIVYVPMKAFAGYSVQFQNEAYLSDFQRFALPESKFHEGEFRCFDIEGDSMEPSFRHGDKVVCSKVELLYLAQTLKEMHNYVIIAENSIYLKRVIIKKLRDGLELISDNNFYPNITINIENIKEVWKVEKRISEGNISRTH